MADKLNDRSDTKQASNELEQLSNALQRGAPGVSRRDVLRWSAITAGALATARFGAQPASAASVARGSVAASQDAAIEENVTIQVPFNPFGQGVTLDPHRTINWGPFWISFPNVWGGLVRYTETAKVELDLAESYEKSPDGLVYTFKIRPDAKFANGRKVVANDFILSWKRALDPKNLAPMAHFMEHIKGYQEFIDGKSQDLGVRAVDDATVEVTLTKPYNFFLSYMAAFVWDVVDTEMVKQHGDTDFVLKDAGTGPWRYTEFDPSTQFVMEPNPNHYGGNSPSIVKIVWPIVTGPTAESTAFNLYKADQGVISDLPLSLKAAAEQDPDLSKEIVKLDVSGSIRWIGMDFTKPPFDDVRVRRAFGMAVDREKWGNEIWQGTWSPAEVFTPPIVSANSPYTSPEGLKYNPDEAKKLLAEAGYPDGKGLPPITYYEGSGDAPDEINRWKALLQLIEQSIGVKIEHDTSKTLDQIDELKKEQGGLQFDVQWWGNITESPQLMSEVFRTDGPYMKGVFNWKADLPAKGGFDPGADAKKFDDLMNQADIEQDKEKADQMYHQGEELLLNDAVCVPLGNAVTMFLQKPYLKGTKQGAWTGSLPIWFNKDVVVVKS
jgi:oligopeptide transport system substrate-binding protein